MEPQPAPAPCPPVRERPLPPRICLWQLRSDHACSCRLGDPCWVTHPVTQPLTKLKLPFDKIQSFPPDSSSHLLEGRLQAGVLCTSQSCFKHISNSLSPPKTVPPILFQIIAPLPTDNSTITISPLHSITVCYGKCKSDLGKSDLC